jgi:alpha-N-arabinofuranosidase
MAVRITIHLDEPIATIAPELYGHFAEHLGTCVNEGLWVGEDSSIPNIGGLRADIVEALKRLRVPVLRWPGGCFADDYHWQDGVGPRKARPRTVNLWWGQTIETNAFGTHEFLNLCRLIGAQPYLAGNLGSGTPRELRDWMEYCNFAGSSTLARRRGENGSPQPFNVRYWGVGNENWGCGGNFCPADYAVEYKRYTTFLKAFSGTHPFLIACGPDSGRPKFHADWTRAFFEKLGKFPHLHGFAAHYYCGTAGTATKYSTDQWYELLAKAHLVEGVITTHRAIMDEFDPQRKIGLILDEWGTWHPPTPGRNPSHLWQQNTLRDALVAAISLDTFHRHADKLVMANIAQLVNVLQAPILTEGDRMILTPTYHVYEMYAAHQGVRSVRTTVETESVTFAVNGERRTMPAVSGSASIAEDGVMTLSLVNVHATLPAEIEVKLRSGATVDDTMQRTVLTHEYITAHNTFDAPDTLAPVTDRMRTSSGDDVRMQLAPASVTVVRARVR